jgi:hypothetical protein
MSAPAKQVVSHWINGQAVIPSGSRMGELPLNFVTGESDPFETA